VSKETDAAKLLVPIHVDGLVVGEKLPPSQLYQWTNLAQDFSKLQDNYVFGSELDSGDGNPFAEAEGLEQGIHLHFRLPRTLTHGSQKGIADVSFPTIPNRWLVQRIAGNDTLAYKAWLIKSDVETQSTSPGMTWPTFYRDKPVEFRTIGCCSELTKPLDEHDEPAKLKLTAVGPGNPAFSAYYPACRGVLGFYDSMADFPEDESIRVSYLVTGWYSHAEDDPLARFSADFHARHSAPSEDTTATEELHKLQFSELLDWANERAWHIDRKTDTAPLRFNLPTRLLCHGLVRGITWAGTKRNYIQTNGLGASTSQSSVFPNNPNNHAKAYKLAAGNTAAEALAALLAPHDFLDQDLLMALQGDLLSQSTDVESLQYELHERRFSDEHGGTTFSIREEPNSADVTAATVPSSSGSIGAIPVPLLALLHQLNEKQQTCDQLFRRLEDYRWQVYALWFLRTRLLKKGVTAKTKPQLELLEKQVTSVKEMLKAERVAWDVVKKQRDELYCADAAAFAHTGKIIDELAKYPRSEFAIDPVFSAQLDAGQLTKALREVFQAHATPLSGEAKLTVVQRGSHWEISDRGNRYLIKYEKPSLNVCLVSKYRLESSAAPSFHTPNDPAIAISGPAMARHNTWQQTGSVLCRMTGQEVTGIELQVPAGRLVKITSKALAEVLFVKDGLFVNRETLPISGGIHATLLGESLLLDDMYAPRIAGLVSGQFVELLTNTIKTLQHPRGVAAQSNPPDVGNALIGCLPDQNLPVNWRGNPWIPLFVVWEVSWQSDYHNTAKCLPEALVTGRWCLDKRKGGDLVMKEDAVDPDNTVKETWYDGYSILTPTTSKNLADRLAALDASHPLVNVLNNLSVQSQVLDGFNDALTLQKTGMQLPPLDFQKYFESGDLQIDSIHDDINHGFDDIEQRDTFRTAPSKRNDPFLPVRAGQLEIKNLSIVDAFGQTLKLPVDKINASTQSDGEEAMLRRAHTCIADSASTVTDVRRLTFRPRFVQPARLRFQWEDASVGPGVKGGPVCGWVVPNHLEKSLAIYSATGKLLGALQKKLGIQAGSSAPNAFYWVSVPGGETSEDQPQPQKRFDEMTKIIEDAHLRHFCNWVLGLSADDGGTFASLIDQSIASTGQRVPDEDAGVSILAGHPLVLVRASLQFELAGLPAHRPVLRSVTVDGAAVTQVGDDRLDTSSFQNIRWPLRLGDLHARNDGLLGVFKCATTGLDPGVTTNGNFYPAWGLGGGDLTSTVLEAQSFADQDFEIDCVHPLQLTMLMDPQARVHATSGALPRTFIELPKETATGAKRAREVFFQTAPVLGLSATPHIPSPSDDYGEWSWAYRPDVTHWTLDPNIVEATDRGGFNDTWPTISEGWLRLAIAPVKVLSFWVREGTEQLEKGANIHLAWSLQGAESVRLEAGGTVLVEWRAAPFPREYCATVQTETTYRITAFAEGMLPSTKELDIRVTK